MYKQKYAGRQPPQLREYKKRENGGCKLNEQLVAEIRNKYQPALIKISSIINLKMLFDKKTKKQVISEFAQGKNDSGSTEVQCAVITKKIDNLTEHLKIHKKDHSSRRGLLILVGKRRRLLDYLKDISNQRYEDLIKKIDIRK